MSIVFHQKKITPSSFRKQDYHQKEEEMLKTFKVEKYQTAFEVYSN